MINYFQAEELGMEVLFIYCLLTASRVSEDFDSDFTR